MLHEGWFLLEDSVEGQREVRISSRLVTVSETEFGEARSNQGLGAVMM